MKINKRSWHYRLMMNVLKLDHPRTLCSYFWTLMWSIFFVCPMVALIAPIALVMWPFVAGYEWLKAKYKFWRSDRRHSQIMNPTPPSVVFSYLKATKNKVCPLIEYEEK